MHPILITVAMGYFLGSVPFGYLLVRAFRGADVRTTGSGNIGATNVARMSPVLGVVTLLLDAMKGFGAVWAVSVLFPGQPMIPFVAGFAAVAGHIFPLWLRFKGGQGHRVGACSFSTRPRCVSARCPRLDRGKCIASHLRIFAERRRKAHRDRDVIGICFAHHCEAPSEYCTDVASHRAQVFGLKRT